MTKNYKLGDRAPKSGEHEIRGPRGGDTGKERTVVGGKESLVSKSGRVIITSPAKSANTVDAWSRAFKK
jgi:hypothetical protein